MRRKKKDAVEQSLNDLARLIVNSQSFEEWVTDAPEDVQKLYTLYTN